MRVLALLLISTSALAAPRRLMVEQTVTGTVWSVGGPPLAGARVTLTCVQTDASRDDARNVLIECDASLRVEQNGKVVARDAGNVDGMSWRAAGGASGGISLELIEAGGVGFIRVYNVGPRGQSGQLFVVAGSQLRQVHRALTDQVILLPSKTSHHGMPDLVAVIRNGPEEDPNASAARGQYTGLVLAWNGTEYTECPKCAQTPAPIVLRRPGAVDVPLVEKALAGAPIDPAALTSLSDQELLVLRNAPYARHGRAFKLPGLHAYFYGGEPYRRSIDPTFTESRLDATDRANVRAVIAEQNRRLAK